MSENNSVICVSPFLLCFYFFVYNFCFTHYQGLSFLSVDIRDRMLLQFTLRNREMLFSGWADTLIFLSFLKLNYFYQLTHFKEHNPQLRLSQVYLAESEPCILIKLFL